MGAFNLNFLKRQKHKISRTVLGGVLGALWTICAFFLFPNDFGGTFLNLFIGLVFAYVGAELGAFITNRVHYKKQILFALSGGIAGFFLPFLINLNATFSVGSSMFTALMLAAFSVVPRKPLLNAIKYGGSLGAIGGFIWGFVVGSEDFNPSWTLLERALVGALIWSLVIITLFLFYWIMNMYTVVKDNDIDEQDHTSNGKDSG